MADSDTPTLPVGLQEVLDICKSLLERVGAQHGDGVELRHDFYWSIPAEQRLDVYNEPQDLTMGQVSDDLERLRALHADPDDYVPPNALVWLGNLLQAIGTELVP